MSFEILDLKMILVFQFADLHILHVLDIRDLLLQLLDLVQQLPRLQVAGR